MHLLNKKWLFLVLVILVATAYIILNPFSRNNPNGKQISTPTTSDQNDSPKIVSTKPDPLENAIISANGIIEVSFNKPLENVGEFKVRIEPKIDLKIELSSDRKTAKLKPAKPLELGASYTLFIGSDTKFDGVGAWGQEKIFHFRTIQYRGV